MTTTSALAIPSLALGIGCHALACTRAVNPGPDETIITVRSIDWGSKADASKLLAADKT